MKKTIYQGREFRSIADLLRFLKIPKCTYDSRKQKGLPTDKLLSTCSLHKRKAVKDPVTGKCYKSVDGNIAKRSVLLSGVIAGLVCIRELSTKALMRLPGRWAYPKPKRDTC